LLPSTVADRPGTSFESVIHAAAVAACCLLAFSMAPSATVLNQLMSTLVWGAAITLSAGAWTLRSLRSNAALTTAAAVLVAGGISSWWAGWMSSPSLTVPVLLVVCVAGVLALSASRQAEGGDESGLFGVMAGFVALGAANVLISVVQVFFPEAADGTVIAKSGLAGRAVGNLRQPNHLSSLALWSAVAVIALLEARRLPQWLAAVLFTGIVVSVELSASRTGMVGVVVMALWGLADKRLSKFSRTLLVAGLLIYALGWLGMSWWAHANHHTFGAEARLAESDVSGSRFGIWSNTWSLIKANPWTGVGFGEFNFAWSLSPFPHRPIAFFDHTHNVVLQLVVELGIPLGGLVVLLLGVALWQAFRRAFAVQGERGAGFRCAFVMVLLMAIHSQVEYPLWYAYFLLPTAWLWGYCLGATPGEAAQGPAPGAGPIARAWPVVAGSLMIAGSAVAFQQYMTVARIFEPGDDQRPLEQRIAQGERSIFFGHHAYYADATVTEPPKDAWPAFRVAPHYLLDTRLMIAWAQAFAGRGDLDRARHIAQRLREFHRPESNEFFAPCAAGAVPAGAPRPFQCDPPGRAVDWREFRDPALWR
jgi:O-antigen ligase